MPEPTIEAFGLAYFARRQRLGPFRTHLLRVFADCYVAVPHLRRAAYCLATPQVLVKHPFSQGLPNCDALARAAVPHLRAL